MVVYWPGVPCQVPTSRTWGPAVRGALGAWPAPAPAAAVPAAVAAAGAATRTPTTAATEASAAAPRRPIRRRPPPPLPASPVPDLALMCHLVSVAAGGPQLETSITTFTSS